MVWDQIKVLMEKNELTSKEIACIAGVVPSAITKWKSGSVIRTDALQKIAIHFGVRLETLLGSETFGTRLRESREWAGLTPETFAKRLNGLFTAEQITRLENGLDPPSSEGFIRKCAEVLGTTVEWLRDGKPAPGHPAPSGPCPECPECKKKDVIIERQNRIIDKLMK